MCFSFGRLAQSCLPESVRIQVNRRQRLIWLEIKDQGFNVSGLQCFKVLVLETLKTFETCEAKHLLTIKFHNQLLVNRQLNIFALRQRQHFRFVIVAIHFQPARHGSMAGKFLRQFENREFLAVLADRNLFAGTQFIRRNVTLAVAHGNVSVTHQLARLAPRLGKSQPVNHIVETAFELLQKPFAGSALRARGLLEVVAELAFLREVNALGFLLLTQLQAVAYNFGLAVLPMLSRSEVALLDGTLIAETFCAFEEQLHALAAA